MIDIQNGICRCLAFILIAPAFSCASPSDGSKSDSLESRYQLAIKDAQNAILEKVYHHLTPIVSSNFNLTWNKDSFGKAEVLVVNWSDYSEYLNHVGQTFQVHRDVWVTVYPELKTRCKEFSKSGLDLSDRLKELLGLPLSTKADLVTEFWVHPEDLFRPCPDPEIDDTSCELDFSKTATDQHRQWFAKQVKASYGSRGYPWTRLGYTYDWAETSKDHVGLSEYVIKPESITRVKSVQTTSEYCGRAP